MEHKENHTNNRIDGWNICTTLPRDEATSWGIGDRAPRCSPPRGAMPLWRDKLVIFLARNASDATSYFQIPTDRPVEIGTRITI